MLPYQLTLDVDTARSEKSVLRINAVALHSSRRRPYRHDPV
jgi:hypothetical protein